MKIQKSQEIPLKTKHFAVVSIAKGAMRLTAIATLHVLTFTPTSMPPALGQVLPIQPSPPAQKESPQNSEQPEEAPQNPQPNQSGWSSTFDGILSGNPISGIPASPVRLDGRRLFSIATPAQDDRAETIQNQLQKVVESKFEPSNLQVYYQILNGLPVLYASIEKREEPIYLLTVTNPDAELHTSEPQVLAEKWKSQIRQALLRAKQERQPKFLLQQAFLAGAIASGAIVLSLSLLLLQRRLKHKQKEIVTESPPAETEIPPVQGIHTQDPSQQNPIESESTIQRQQTESITELQHKMTQRQKLNLNDIKLRLAQCGQVVIWGGGMYWTVGLFPYTRWIRPLMLSWLPLPLQLLAVGFGTYVAVRLSAVLIDRFFTALQDGAFHDADASRRLALRFSTFSGVFKSLSALGIVGIGILWGLAIVGIDLAPILAGAGIIGLGISLASQSLIKDTINGFLILFEDQYAIGDVIVVGDVGGLVENMNLRITQLRNGEGRLITIPNSAISIVQNLSKEWARVDLTIEVAYHTDMDRALAVLQQMSDEIYNEPEWRAKIIDPPEVLGIDEIDHAGVLIRIWIKTKPLQHWSVGREFRRRMKARLDREGISIGMPQQSLVFQSSLELLKQARNGKHSQEQKLILAQSSDPSN